MTLRQFIYPLTVAILSGMAVSSCSSTDSEPIIPDNGETSATGRITMSISAAPLAVSSTRANFPELPAESKELINEWYIAFVDVDGNVVAVEDNSKLPGVWNDVVSTELQLNKIYTAFAFANFQDSPKASDGNEKYSGSAEYAKTLGLEKGKRININDIKESVYSDKRLYLNKEELIPMAGYLEFTPKGTVNETFAIEVVRLYSRVEFAFVKNINTKIKINSISLDHINSGSINLMPDYNKKPYPDNEWPGNNPSLPSEENTTSEIKLNLNDFEVQDDSGEGNDDPAQRIRFYIKESIVNKGERFKIGLNLERIDGDNEVEESIERLTDENLRFFYRNDYVLFPITFNYTPEIRVYDYPPIGGYPVKVTNVGTAYTAMFSSSGAFDIETSLVDRDGKIIKLGTDEGKSNYVEWTLPKTPEDLKLEFDEKSKRWVGDFPFDYKESITIDFKFHVGDLIYSRSLTLKVGLP